jgi:uncharacterized membrane protein YkoI
MGNLKKIVAGVAALAALALGGAAIAGATSGGSDSPDRGDGDGELSAAVEQQAGRAALKVTGGGTLGQIERDGEKGATYEVEVNRPDGSQVDVRLDGQFNKVAIDSDHEDSGESAGD